MTHPWPAGAVTGIGSLPGTDPVEALAFVFGEVPDFPYLPELPARGPGAGLIGRTAALLVDLPVELLATQWRLAAHSGLDLRRARDLLARDLDALEQRAAGFTGPLKLQAAGPWTLAATVELANGHKIVTDQGATRDLVESLTEGLRLHLADVGARVPGAALVLQLDEPSLPAVLAGRVATPSGYGTVRAVAAPVAETTLRQVLEVAPAGARVVHSCAADVSLELLRRGGADAVSVDAALLDASDYDALGEAVEAGVSLWLGVVPTTGTPSAEQGQLRIELLWRELGFPRDQLGDHVVATPACGLAGSTPEHARQTCTALREIGRWLADPDR